MEGLSLLLIWKAFHCCLYERPFIVAYMKDLSLLLIWKAFHCCLYECPFIVAYMKGLSLLLIWMAFHCCLYECPFIVAYMKVLSLLLIWMSFHCCLYERPFIAPYAARQCTPYIVTSLWQTNPTEIPFSLANEPYRNRALFQKGLMWWLWLVGSKKLQVAFAENHLFYRALLQKRPMILRSLLVEATP